MDHSPVTSRHLDAPGNIVIFGPFRLDKGRRSLIAGGQPVQLGARAMDLLLELTARAGEFLGTRELLDKVWAGAQIEESNLRFQVKRLREALASHAPGTTFITSNPGRGYCFIAGVTELVGHATVETPREASPAPLPSLPESLIGRDAEIDAIVQRMGEQRAVTLVGPGGSGKTTVAIAAAARFSATTSRRQIFIDLSLIRDPALVASAAATALGLPVVSSDPLPFMVRRLADAHDLLVLDNCEHVIEQAALLAEALLKGAPSLRLLATSREPCGFAQEFVHWLPPLTVPPAGHTTPLAFPAAQLFLERSRLRRRDLRA